jgi:DNA polymerase-3 subunit gamma/tau
MRDAQSLLDRILAYSRGDISDAEVEELLGRVDRSMLYRITEAVLSEDPQGCLQALNTLYDSGIEVRQFYYAYLEHLRDLMLAKMSNAPAALLDIPEEDAQEIMRLANRATAEDLRSYFRLWFSSEEEINRSALPKIALEMCCLEMVNVKKSIPIDDVLKKLDDLQQRLGGKVGSVAAPPQYASGAGAPAVVKEPARSLREKPAPYTPSPADVAAVTPARSDDEKDTAGFLAYIRQKDLPLASQLEHGNISMSDKNEIIIELPGNSFFLDNIKDGNTGKKISSYGEEFFKCIMTVRVVTGEHAAPEDYEQKKNLERKKKQQEALHNPLIQKILETFDGKIIEVKTEL